MAAQNQKQIVVFGVLAVLFIFASMILYQPADSITGQGFFDFLRAKEIPRATREVQTTQETKTIQWPNGATCTTNDQCQSNYCSNGLCATAPRTNLQAGEQCISNTECASNYCDPLLDTCQSQPGPPTSPTTCTLDSCTEQALDNLELDCKQFTWPRSYRGVRTTGGYGLPNTDVTNAQNGQQFCDAIGQSCATVTVRRTETSRVNVYDNTTLPPTEMDTRFVFQKTKEDRPLTCLAALTDGNPQSSGYNDSTGMISFAWDIDQPKIWCCNIQ